MAEKIKILFLCTGNSCRSQMAEGWARHLKGNVLEPYSAGTVKSRLNPYAVRVMAEAGVDISGHWSKNADELKNVSFDWVVTVCDHANENCPYFPGEVRRKHVGFDDPPRLTEGMAGEEAKLAVYRRVRDEIKQLIKTLPEGLEK